MGCAGAAEAVRGERDITFANERTFGDAALDRIAAVSKAVQQKKAQIKLKRHKAAWLKEQSAENAFQDPEVEAADADWWSGDGGNVIKQVRDETPFEVIQEGEDDYDAYDDYDYDAFDDDYDWGTGDTTADLDFAGDTSIAPPQHSEEPVRVSRKPDTKGRDKTDPRGNSSSEEGNNASNARKAQPKARGKSAAKGDPWADSDDSDTPQAKPKGRPKQPQPARSSTSSEDAKRKDLAATKIQAAQRGRKERKQVEETKRTRPRPKTRAQGKRSNSNQAKEQPSHLPKTDPWVDDSDSSTGKGPTSPARPKPKARGKSALSSDKSQKAPLLSNRRDTGDSDVSSQDMAGSRTAPPSPNPRTKARPKPRPAKSPAAMTGSRSAPGNQPTKSAALDDSSDDDGGKVMF
mmetsp:Transcript_6518/g.10458  ORF Transcript_6518/g.10458 Transcript_6518/m.10458 type:complete len:405 (+) Transcript_6518:3-1217(+)